MQLVTIDDVPGGSLGARLGDGVILHFGRAAKPGTVETWVPRTMIGLLEAGEDGLEVARRIVSRAEDCASYDALHAAGAILPADTRLLAPIPNPRMIVAAGLAYRSHLAEMAGTPAPPHPTGFMKSPASVAAPGASLALPAQAPSQVDYEGELACVFGRECHAVGADEAMAYLAGFTVANDLSARDWVYDVWSATSPWEARLTWEVNIMGKQLPGFTPLGPVMTTVDEIPDVNALRLVTRLNDIEMQSALFSDMIFSIADVIAHFSRWYRFQPGDILLTGTPAGVGVGRKPQMFLKPGDLISVEIDRIGTLSTPVLPMVPPRRAETI